MLWYSTFPTLSVKDKYALGCSSDCGALCDNVCVIYVDDPVLRKCQAINGLTCASFSSLGLCGEQHNDLFVIIDLIEVKLCGITQKGAPFILIIYVRFHRIIIVSGGALAGGVITEFT